MVSPGKWRRLVYGLGALGIAALCCALVAAADILRLTYNVPGDSKPIVFHADQMTTWMDGGKRIVLLKGKVLIEHGVVEARMQQAVAWVDQDGYRKTGIMRVSVYAEGDVTLENGPENRSGEKALIDLSTRGEVKLKAHNSKVNQQSRPDDPLYRRAQEIRAPGQKSSSAAPLKQVSFQELAQAQPSLPPDQNLLPPQRPVGPPALGPPPTAAPILPPSSPVNPVPPPAAAASPTPLGISPPAPSAAAPPTGTPAAPPTTPPPAPRGGPANVFDGQPKSFSILPRTAAGYDVRNFLLANGEHASAVTGGVILVIRNPNNTPLVDIEADRLVYWTRNNPEQLFSNMRTAQGQTSRDLEFYLAGNVEIRQQDKQGTRTLRADEVYYDVSRNIAVAMQAELEFKQPNVPDPVHMRAQELIQLSPTLFKGLRVDVYSSRLPSDPGLKVGVSEGMLEDKQIPKRSIFGIQVINRQTGQPETEEERLFTGRNAVIRFDDVPFFYFPYVRGDANDPLGPLSSIGINYNAILGFQVYTTFNAYNLFGIDPYPGTRWKLYLDYLSLRGPGLGSTFEYSEPDFFDIPAKVSGLVKAYGIYDTHIDQLGGPNRFGLPRGSEDEHPDARGRFLWRQNIQDLPYGFSVQSQVSVLSDKNYLEQYFKSEFDNEINQETFLYVKQQQDSWAWTLLTEPRIRNWVTETEWLPRADGYLIGQSFLDLFNYNAHASVGYAQLQPSQRPPPVELTDQRDNTGRFDLMQELSAPFSLGPFRLVPYGVLDLTQYTEDLTGSERGRFYVGGGLRSSIPFTRLYPDVQSDLFNLNGLNHKIVLASNYYIAHSDTPFTRLPQLDRLNDDATDQSLRDIKPREAEFNPAHGTFITTSPIFDPQIYAIRRLLDNRVDTLDTIEVFQGEIDQRLQTKRGYPGQQHIVDWMTLDLSASFFPHAGRDNFGQNFGFLEYRWTWNIGDQTQLYSSGLADPATHDGTRFFSMGASFYRSDRTTVTLEYREIDPLESQAVNTSLTYVFSPKYAMTAVVAYDFGTGSQFNQVTLTRIGTDLQVSAGFYYDSVFKNFGVNFEILPAILPPSKRYQGVATLDPSTFGKR
ncbi:MAG TPA: hypothetical protein VKU02_07390 [Gemmataceae bacterium]|nr:hypothetical protein [Gemmataceae bacterium]